jgi:CDGSH-type Zn-finger protein
MDRSKMKIKITKDGPYLVSGGVPLTEKIITPGEKGYEWKDGRKLPQAESYALCRCGHSKNPPFCDGTHAKVAFSGEETASKTEYANRAKTTQGPALDLMDDGRCAFARFCQRKSGSAWELVAHSDDPAVKEEAVLAAGGCPSGRLTAVSKTKEALEPEYEGAIEMIQDPQKDCSGGIFVKGNIPIESSDGEMYEVRNRVVLCRCGGSKNKPFCDSSHVKLKYKDR